MTSDVLQVLAWWLDYVTPFSPLAPWEIEMNGETVMTRGRGLGYLSQTLITRGARCEACGRCCRGSPWKPAVFWLEGANRPLLSDMKSSHVKINGFSMLVHYYTHHPPNPCGSGTACAFLDGDLCVLHEQNLKPSGCSLSPIPV